MIIVGAGFSYYAGLPLQSGFTAELLRATRFLKGPSKRITDFLCQFVRADFHARKLDTWPALEDLFTCIDLSANTGHHLGREYCPSQLRTVRRALLTRIIRMLWQSYGRASTNRRRTTFATPMAQFYRGTALIGFYVKSSKTSRTAVPGCWSNCVT